MKKWMILVLTIVMTAMLTGCGLLSKLGNALNAGMEVLREEGTQASEETEEGTEETEEAEIAERIDSDTIKFTLETKYDSEYDADYNEIARMRYDSINITSDSTPQLKTAIDAWNKEYSNSTESCYTEYAECAKTDCQDTEYWFEDTYYGIEGDLMVRRADGSVFSFLNPEYSYCGGAHGYYGYGAYNFDSQTGEKIGIGDIVTDTQTFCDTVEKEFLKYYSNDELLYFEDLSDYVYSTYFTESKENGELIYIIGYDGITVIFNPYEITSYAMGAIMVDISTDAYPGLLEEKYFANVSDNYLYEIPVGDIMKLDLNQDGAEESLSVYALKDEYDTYDLITVTINGNETTKESYFYSYSTYYVKNNGNSYLYVQTSAESDYQQILVFDLNGSTPFFVGEATGAMECTVDPTLFNMDKRLDALSTYSGLLPSYVGNDGMPTSDTNVYILDTFFSLTSTVNLTGELVDADSLEPLGEEVVVPAGSNFEFAYTDGTTFVIFKINGVGLVKFDIEVEWPQIINGMDAEECFETLYFAG